MTMGIQIQAGGVSVLPGGVLLATEGDPCCCSVPACCDGVSASFVGTGGSNTLYLPWSTTAFSIAVTATAQSAPHANLAVCDWWRLTAFNPSVTYCENPPEDPVGGSPPASYTLNFTVTQKDGRMTYVIWICGKPFYVYYGWETCTGILPRDGDNCCFDVNSELLISYDFTVPSISPHARSAIWLEVLNHFASGTNLTYVHGGLSGRFWSEGESYTGSSWPDSAGNSQGGSGTSPSLATREYTDSVGGVWRAKGYIRLTYYSGAYCWHWYLLISHTSLPVEGFYLYFGGADSLPFTLTGDCRGVNYLSADSSRAMMWNYHSFGTPGNEYINGISGHLKIKVINNVCCYFDCTPLATAWSAATAYGAGAMVIATAGAGDTLFHATQTSTNKHPASNPTYWEPLMLCGCNKFPLSAFDGDSWPCDYNPEI